jgi:hypothetical protein
VSKLHRSRPGAGRQVSRDGKTALATRNRVADVEPAARAGSTVIPRRVSLPTEHTPPKDGLDLAERILQLLLGQDWQGVLKLLALIGGVVLALGALAALLLLPGILLGMPSWLSGVATLTSVGTVGASAMIRRHQQRSCAGWLNVRAEPQKRAEGHAGEAEPEARQRA